MQRTILALFIIFSLWIGFVAYVIGFNFIPFDGGGDTTGWEYTGFYLWEHLQFKPFPSLDFFSNSTFYPLGTSVVFLSWGLERDYFYSLFYAFFGVGPWLQIYTGLSFLFAAAGSFLLLKKEFGVAKALFCALIATFCNTYAINKYPDHVGITVCHWTILSVYADFLLLHKLQKGSLGVHDLWLRGLFLLLSFGQEFGYNLGLSLTSFTIVSIYILLRSIISYAKGYWQMASLKKLLANYWQQLWTDKISTALLLLSSAIAGFLICPLVLQILLEARKNHIDGFIDGSWFASPSRIFLPLLSFLNPKNYQEWGINFKDHPEGYSPNTIGWFLLSVGLISAYFARKRFLLLSPFIILFFILLTYNPANHTLRLIFPWFKYARVGSRFTLLFPTLISLLVLSARFPIFSQLNFRKKILNIFIFLILFFLFIGELPNMYSGHHGQSRLSAFPASFYTAMDKLRKAPGEVVLDWPFCSSGGNGGGYCASHEGLSIWGLRKYHHKKVLGGSLARLHPDVANIYRASGLENLLITQNERCLNAQELDFLHLYYMLGDFSGMIIHKNLLANECISSLLKKFKTKNSAILTTSSAHIGEDIIIFKDANERAKKNPESANSLTLGNVTLLPNLLEILAKEFALQMILLDSKDAIDKELIGGKMPFISEINANIDKTKVLFISLKPHPELQEIMTMQPFHFYLQKSPFKEEVVYDFKKQKENAVQENILNTDVFNNDGLIFTHPTLNTATLKYRTVDLPKNAYIRFGIELRNIKFSARYSILINEKEIFAFEMDRPTLIQSFLLPLPEEKTANIEFRVEPKKSNDFCHSFWFTPVIIIEKEEKNV